MGNRAPAMPPGPSRATHSGGYLSSLEDGAELIPLTEPGFQDGGRFIVHTGTGQPVL